MNTTTTRKRNKAKAYYIASFGHKHIHVYRRTTPSGNYGFLVDDTSEVDDNGKIKRRLRSFADEALAKDFADKLAERLSRNESTAMRLSEAEAIEYVSARETLRPFNIAVLAACSTVAECLRVLGDGVASIHAAAAFYRAHHKPVTAKPVADVVAEMLLAKEKRTETGEPASDRYRADLRKRLGHFAKDCRKDACNVTKDDVQAWLDNRKRKNGQPISKVSYLNYRRVLHTLFSWAVKKGYATSNPAAETDDIKKKTYDVEIYSPIEIARLLEAAKANYPDYLPCLAIAAFAGLRSAEIERLDWKNVDLAERCIDLKSEQAKTATRRLVPIHDNLAQWLSPYAGKSGKVWPDSRSLFYVRQREIAAATAVAADEAKGIKAQPPVKWKSNACRHSFGSYRLAQVKDPGRVAAELGNSPAVLFKHYDNVARPAAAERYFSVKPDAPANVVTLPAAAVAGQ